MTSTLLTPPVDPGPPAPPPARRPPGRRTLALSLAGAALLGAAGCVGVLAISGELGDHPVRTTTTTVVRRDGSQAAALDAAAVYDAAAAGSVDIAATSATTGGPLGPAAGESTATGSGFVVDREGHIVTASHVVENARTITVTFADGTSRTATVAGQDDATDVAVLKVNPGRLTLHPLALGSAAALDVGDPVAAVGSPFGYAGSISAGIVSGLDRTIEAPNGFTVAHAIQTDAALNPGNSGGPIVDAAGRVVGIADQIATSGSAEQGAGVGFAVPIDIVAGELDQLEAGRTVSHAYLGVSTSQSGSQAGALVAGVADGGPAADGGLRVGDVVIAIDGTAVHGSGDLVAAISALEPGDRIELAIRRDGKSRTLTVTLGTQPSARGSAENP